MTTRTRRGETGGYGSLSAYQEKALGLDARDLRKLKAQLPEG
ncbi:hypothetical protein [Streptomyces actinomycinicus]|nr:hypothetical protein [Streptomyces actinomycinicus]